MKQTIRCLLLLFLLVRIPLWGQNFTETHPFLHYGNGGMNWGDSNNDGALDLLLNGNSASGTGGTSLYKNHAGQFSEVTAGLPPLYGGSAKWGDFDNDDDLDLLVCGTNPAGDGKTLLYRNNNGIFVLEDEPFTGITAGEAIWLDYNNDGWLDVLITGDSSYNTPVTRLFRNNGNGTFSGITTGLVFAQAGFVAAGDYDNDGDADILLGGECDCDSGYVTRLYKNEQGTFTDSGIYFQGIGYGDGIFVDYDNDGDLDFVEIGSTTQSDYVVYLYRNDGNDQFTKVITPMEGEWAGHIDVTDINNDGFPDIGITGSLCCGDALTALYLNDGNGNFTLLSDNFPTVANSQINFGDYDNDGDSDFALTGVPASGLETAYSGLFTNQMTEGTFHANLPPSVPVGLTETVTGDEVTLNWERSSDDVTPSVALTYNLRIGRSPGTMEVIAPLSNPETGYPKVYGRGNCGQVNVHTIRSLPNGTYYWSVQALDAGGAASLFAPVQSFQIGSVGSPLLFQEESSVTLLYDHIRNQIIITSDERCSGSTFQITDLSGRVIFTGQILGKHQLVSTESLRPGLYILLFQQENLHIQKRMLIY